eukprot:TRINITY_DN13131_c0_g1_i1.p2 TRINITY_DN13131_c0_g1~~TRINITY_DN13131_c0_g1_i1.p2  ORF type:complete len:122 (-),score=25.51 TRINITY_DN13131_c0_g1_i1:294-659(-)
MKLWQRWRKEGESFVYEPEEGRMSLLVHVVNGDEIVGIVVVLVVAVVGVVDNFGGMEMGVAKKKSEMEGEGERRMKEDSSLSLSSKKSWRGVGKKLEVLNLNEEKVEESWWHLDWHFGSSV